MRLVVIALIVSVGFSSWAGSLKDAVEQLKEVQIEVLEDGREVLADTESGLTLYTFDVDDEGVSNCFDRCLKVWPVMAAESKKISKPFGIHKREDGVMQLVLSGSPLYFYIKDKKAGDIMGDGVGSVWHLIDLTKE